MFHQSDHHMALIQTVGPHNLASICMHRFGRGISNEGTGLWNAQMSPCTWPYISSDASYLGMNNIAYVLGQLASMVKVSIPEEFKNARWMYSKCIPGAGREFPRGLEFNYYSIGSPGRTTNNRMAGREFLWGLEFNYYSKGLPGPTTKKGPPVWRWLGRFGMFILDVNLGVS